MTDKRESDVIILTAPAEEHEGRVMDLVREHRSFGERRIPGGDEIETATSYGDWLKKIRAEAAGVDIAADRVPATTYIAVRQGDHAIVGVLNLRHRLNDYLLHLGGHIGYAVRPSEGGKGYAKQMLALALEECRRLRLDRVLVTCDRANAASAKVIQANGGVLENEVVDKGGVWRQRYWIVTAPESFPKPKTP